MALIEENLAVDFLPFQYVLDGDNAELGQSMGMTFNLGNFQSIRFDYSLKVPVAPIKEELAKAEEFINNTIVEKLLEFRKFVKENGKSLS